MKTRTDLLNHLIQKHRLKSYLEIGLQDASQNFDKIVCDRKVSVDPDPNAKATYILTSDVFFDYVYAKPPFDLIFIDGLHTADQVKKDFENALNVLSPNGFIVIHDCNPLKEEHTIVPRPTDRGHWNGDVYKFACQLAKNWVAYRTVDIDNGCGVFYNCFPHHHYGNVPDWDYFNKYRKILLNLISWDEFVKL